MICVSSGLLLVFRCIRMWVVVLVLINFRICIGRWLRMLFWVLLCRFRLMLCVCILKCRCLLGVSGVWVMCICSVLLGRIRVSRL